MTIIPSASLHHTFPSTSLHTPVSLEQQPQQHERGTPRWRVMIDPYAIPYEPDPAERLAAWEHSEPCADRIALYASLIREWTGCVPVHVSSATGAQVSIGLTLDDHGALFCLHASQPTLEVAYLDLCEQIHAMISPFLQERVETSGWNWLTV